LKEKIKAVFKNKKWVGVPWDLHFSIDRVNARIVRSTMGTKRLGGAMEKKLCNEQGWLVA